MVRAAAPGRAEGRTRIVRFGEFELNQDTFELLRAGEPVALEPRVLSLLCFLIDNRGQLVGKDRLLDELWGHRFVSESALATQIKRLRQALGDDGQKQEIIKTVHGRGYRFVADTQHGPVRSTQPQDDGIPSQRLSNLGYERTPFFGRTRELRRCIEAFQNYRMVSLLGIGGTGKTRLAKAVGRAVLDDYPDGVWFVDLVPVVNAAGIDTAMASALGIKMGNGSLREQLAAAIRQRRALFILDNCEHIEDDVAVALDFLLENTAAPHFLITSRDPIDLADELRFFVDPLALHVEDGESPAVQLFLSTARRHGMVDQMFDVAKVEQVCEQLDGLPLAIELAAAQLKHLTLEELLERLDRRFDLLAGRQRIRTGADRQESLAAVVRETWQLLNHDEQRLLGQIAVFPGQFTIADIEEVYTEQMTQSISFCISRLVELCMLSRTSAEGSWWRLLETVRLYALEQLSANERVANGERHAHWCLARLGDYPYGSLLSYAHAQWAADHYADITAAERFFSRQGRIDAAIDVCTQPGLLIQMDEGARALTKLDRIGDYLGQTDDLLCRVKLHGMAALCALVTRDPALFEHHAGVHLELARTLDAPSRLTVALILASLISTLSDPELARRQLAEAINVAQTAGETGSLDLARTYQAWGLTMQKQYGEATAAALEVIEKNLTRDVIDNPTHSAICAVIACNCLADPQTANRWTDRLLESSQVHSLLGARALFACSRAAGGQLREAAELCSGIVSRLTRMGVQPWPDLFVPLAVMAHSQGETDKAQLWLRRVQASDTRLQTFHTITVYRQLRSRIGLGASDAADGKPLSETGAQALAWMRQFLEN